MSVSDNEDAEPDSSDATLRSRSVDPMIVTVDFSRRASTRDSYRTVDLTSAEAEVITFARTARPRTRTFNLTTEISSPDNIKFTIPLLNPKIGTYALTVKAQDQAGNNDVTGLRDTEESPVLGSDCGQAGGHRPGPAGTWYPCPSSPATRRSTR